MCPHCGEEVEVKGSLHPRCAESDARPLWNGKPNTRFAG